MNLIEALGGGILQILNWILTPVIVVLQGLFELFFFWLPADPFIDYINNFDLVNSDISLGLSWLNWFVDVSAFATLTSLGIAATMAYAAFHFIKWLVSVTQRTIENIPAVE